MKQICILAISVMKYEHEIISKWFHKCNQIITYKRDNVFNITVDGLREAPLGMTCIVQNY